MNVLHINTLDVMGGAAKAMYRLHESLVRAGHTSRAMVGFRRSTNPNIDTVGEQSRRVRSVGDKLLDRGSSTLRKLTGLESWSYRSSFRIPATAMFQQADIVHLHNLHGGYFNLKALAAITHLKPVVWTLHDMWPLTGHCAYSYNCERWRGGCYDCPLLKPPGRRLVEPAPGPFDLSRRAWRQKRDLYRALRLHIVTPSRWLGKLVDDSILGRAASKHTIPYGVDLALFRPADKSASRAALDLSLDADIIFFSADRLANERKGLRYLLQALRRVSRSSRPLLLLTSGAGISHEGVPTDVQVRNLGYLGDSLQRLAFCAADLLAFPSLADNLPLVVVEAVACGTPVVAFDVGGVSEIITHEQTGYLARYRDIDDLSHGITRILGDRGLQARLSDNCRNMAESHFALELEAERYVSVYQDVLSA